MPSARAVGASGPSGLRPCALQGASCVRASRGGLGAAPTHWPGWTPGPPLELAFGRLPAPSAVAALPWGARLGPAALGPPLRGGFGPVACGSLSARSRSPRPRPSARPCTGRPRAAVGRLSAPSRCPTARCARGPGAGGRGPPASASARPGLRPPPPIARLGALRARRGRCAPLLARHGVGSPLPLPGRPGGRPGKGAAARQRLAPRSLRLRLAVLAGLRSAAPLRSLRSLRAALASGASVLLRWPRACALRLPHDPTGD